MKIVVFMNTIPSADQIERYGKLAYFTNPQDLIWSVRQKYKGMRLAETTRTKNGYRLRFES